MQRIPPRPEEPQQSQAAYGQQQVQEGGGQGNGRPQAGSGFVSTGANPHTQSFEEIYGVPENFLEIEVCLAYLHLERRGGVHVGNGLIKSKESMLTVRPR
jgi:hypothetical protein